MNPFALPLPAQKAVPGKAPHNWREGGDHFLQPRSIEVRTCKKCPCTKYLLGLQVISKFII